MPGEEQAVGGLTAQPWWTLARAAAEVLKRHLATTSTMGALVLSKVKCYPVKISKPQLLIKVWLSVLIVDGCGCSCEGNEWLLWRVLRIKCK